MKKKIKWLLLLFIAIFSFAFALWTKQLLFNFLAIGLAIVIYKYGNPVLFEEYEQRRKEKLELQKRMVETYAKKRKVRR